MPLAHDGRPLPAGTDADTPAAGMTVVCLRPGSGLSGRTPETRAPAGCRDPYPGQERVAGVGQVVQVLAADRPHDAAVGAAEGQRRENVPGSGSRYTPPAARTSATVTGGETPIVSESTGEALTTGLTLPALTAARLAPAPLQAVTSAAVPARATIARAGFIPPTTPAKAARLCLDDMPSGAAIF